MTQTYLSKCIKFIKNEFGNIKCMIVVMRYFRDFFFLSIPLKTILVIVTHCIVTYKEILEVTRKFDENGLIERRSYICFA